MNKAFSPMCTDGGEEQNLKGTCHQASQREQYHAHEGTQMWWGILCIDLSDMN